MRQNAGGHRQSSWLSRRLVLLSHCCQSRGVVQRKTSILLEFGLKSVGISCQNNSNRCLAFEIVLRQIVTGQTSTILAAVNFHTKALTVQFQALGLFASTSHGSHLFSVKVFDLRGRGGTVCSSFHFHHVSHVGMFQLSGIALWRGRILVRRRIDMGKYFPPQSGIREVVRSSGRMSVKGCFVVTVRIWHGSTIRWRIPSQIGMVIGMRRWRCARARGCSIVFTRRRF